jgi:uncharacterized membrane protein YfcA
VESIGTGLDGTVVSLVLIGLGAGFAAGIFGIGGGILIVPALVYVLGFSPQKATGTSLAILLPPVGLAAVTEYYRHGNVDVRAAVVIASMLFIGAWAGAALANHFDPFRMKVLFGVFVVLVGVYTIVEAFLARAAA